MQSPSTTLFTLSMYVKFSSSLPSAEGMMENVFEIPSCASLKGSFATDASDATAPEESLPYMGLAPGAKGAPLGRPSGVAPVFFPYTTLDVIVSTDVVGTELRYV